MNFFLLFIISINILLLFFTFFYIEKISTKINLIDDPRLKTTKIHSKPISNAGGVIVVCFLLNYIFVDFYLYNYEFDLFYKNFQKNFSIYIFILSFCFIGLADDYFNISPKYRILAITIVSLIMILINNDLLVKEFFISSLNYNFVFNNNYLGIVFTLFCIIFLQNTFNMFDGINGSLLSIVLPVILILLFVQFSIFLFLSFIILIIILYFNLKNRIFLGNNGAFAISGLISVFLILYHKENSYLLSGDRMFLLLILPILDLCRLFIIRLKNKKNPFKGDLSHFHHIVLRKFKIKVWFPSVVIFVLCGYYLSFIINTLLVIFLATILYLIIIYIYKT